MPASSTTFVWLPEGGHQVAGLLLEFPVGGGQVLYLLVQARVVLLALKLDCVDVLLVLLERLVEGLDEAVHGLLVLTELALGVHDQLPQALGGEPQEVLARALERRGGECVEGVGHLLLHVLKEGLLLVEVLKGRLQLRFRPGPCLPLRVQGLPEREELPLLPLRLAP
jgi:hypothetical protein